MGYLFFIFLTLKILSITTFKYGETTEKIIGAAFKVHNTLGPGFQEVIYQRALELELKAVMIEHIREFECRYFTMSSRSAREELIFW